MKVLITGAGGFVGSALAAHLSKSNEVIALGRNADKMQALSDLLGDSVRIVCGSTGSDGALAQALPGVDVIVHLAGGGGNKGCMRDPARAVMSYCYDTRRLLDRAHAAGVPRIVFASTISVYTTFRERPLPFVESMDPQPDDFYGALKTAAEQDVMTSPLDAVSLRLSNIYGWGSGLQMAYMGGAANHFVRAACEGRKLPVTGGDQKIDYVHVDDVVRCIVSLIARPEIKNEVFNVGSGSMRSIRSLAEQVCELSESLFGRPSFIDRKPAQEGHVWSDRYLSIDKIADAIGWRPAVTFEEGFGAMLGRYRESR